MKRDGGGRPFRGAGREGGRDRGRGGGARGARGGPGAGRGGDARTDTRGYARGDSGGGGPPRGGAGPMTPGVLARTWNGARGVLTENQVPGVRVYGERLVRHKGKELRAWNPRRSKLAALLLAVRERNAEVPLRMAGNERVLYLGAASGTTVSHISDILADGSILAVEKSARSFRDLLQVARARGNVQPILSDAHDVDGVGAIVARPVDVLYQDIAQRDQARIFTKNAARFLRPGGTGILMLKSRSISVAKDPDIVYGETASSLMEAGLDIVTIIPLEPWERDHAAIVVTKEAT